MPLTRRVLAFALFAGACELPPDSAVDNAPEDVTNHCPFDQPVRIAEFPDDLAVGAGGTGIAAVGPLLYVRAQGNIMLLDPCTGEHAPYDEAQLARIYPLETPNGFQLYSVSDTGEVAVLDRLDVPGFDPLRPLPELRAISMIHKAAGGVLLCTVQKPGETFSCWRHDGDPEHPPALLSDAIARFLDLGERTLVLDGEGELRAFDEATGSFTPLLSGVRRFWLDGGYLFWETGDDASVSVFRRDLETNEDLLLRDGLDPLRSQWIVAGDGELVGLVGAERTLEVVFRLTDGSELAVPEHIGVADRALGPDFELFLADPEQHVRALWDPRTGEGPRVWYRGDLWSTELWPRRSEDTIVYAIQDICMPTRTYWKADLRTGTHAMIAGGVEGSLTTLADGRYLATISYDWGGSPDLVVLDPVTFKQRLIVAEVEGWSIRPDQGLYYLDAQGDDRGIWGTSLP